jgi:hypothetical protein
LISIAPTKKYIAADKAHKRATSRAGSQRGEGNEKWEGPSLKRFLKKDPLGAFK